MGGGGPVGEGVGRGVGTAINISVAGKKITSVIVASANVAKQISPQRPALSLRLMVNSPLSTCSVIYDVIVLYKLATTFCVEVSVTD